MLTYRWSRCRSIITSINVLLAAFLLGATIVLVDDGLQPVNPEIISKPASVTALRFLLHEDALMCMQTVIETMPNGETQMERARSPNYPAIPLDQAIDLVGQIHSKSRTNIIDRESAAKDMGYSGLTGRSIAMLGALAQYGLVERAGKGDLRVTPIAVDILHGLTEQDKKKALLAAGTAPKLFKSIFDRFTDGVPSDNVVRSFLIQQGYADGAIGPAIKAFSQTNRFLEVSGVSDSHGNEGQDESNALSPEEVADILVPIAPPAPPPPAVQHGGYRVMEGERVVFSEEVGTASHLKLVASGDMNIDLLDALEDFIRRTKKRLKIDEG